MKVYVFPGQGAQFIGMGKDLYDNTLIGKKLFEKANKILGLADKIVEEVIYSIDEVVVPANYNGPKQLVISGSLKGIETASQKLKEAGAKHIIPLKVDGVFHSLLMEPARVELAKAINETTFNQPTCPIYQNVNAKPATNPAVIRENLIAQLISPVHWYQTVLNMIADSVHTFIEVGPGNVLQNLIKRIAPKNIDVLGVSSFHGDTR